MASIAIALVPFVLFVIVHPNDALPFSLVLWLVGAIAGLRGLRHRGAARTVAWVGLFMNILIPLLGWMFAPLLVGLLMSQSMP
jgi:hypothetical protein